jgi:hypothetical protein
MKDLKLVKDFVPSGCNCEPLAVMSGGPGANFAEIYKFGGDNGVITVGGYTVTVGGNGGYTLGGGGGPLCLKHGMAVDSEYPKPLSPC